ncbi:hypothetical protein QBC39DRAFT_423828 [Podospora conica]|nr:hypothetical protein QBC39DRAFT_423828 [Schizothecium conicum]
MSADLFAAFESPSQAPNSQQTQSTPGGPPFQPSTDPFSFIATPPAIPQPQTSRIHPQLSAWSSVPQQQQPAQPAWTGWPAPQPQPSQSSGGWGDLGGLGSVQSPAVMAASPAQEDDDGWGDFEAPVDEPSPPVIPSTKAATAPPPGRTRITRASTIDMLTNKLIDLDVASLALESRQEQPLREKTEQPKRAEPPQKPVQPKSDPNVLFDADDFELQDDMVDDEDDFGDFETVDPVPPPPKPVVAVSVIDLLSSEPHSSTVQPKKQPPGLVLSNAALNNNPLPYPQAPKSPYGSFQTRKPEAAKALQVKTPLSAEFPKSLQKDESASPTPVTAWPSLENDAFDSDWAEFKDKPQATKKTAPPKAKTKPVPPKASAAATSDWEWNEWGDSEKKDTPKAASTSVITPAAAPAQQTGPPPTNIPPPSIILSIFPELFNLASDALLKPMSSLAPNTQQRVLSDSSTATFLRGYLALATVAARVIAGRKQRWHRDKFLMQSMSISAASGGKTRGMKLAGVDKAQAAREDREAGEVVAAWKQQVGRLRTAVVAANKDGGPQLRVPELSAALSAHVAAGTVTAPKACVVCGLKRDERIARVDFDVEDSFGEWWVEFWGHRDCRNFWLEHEVKLRQR